MVVPTIPGWKAETIGDDICWMKFGPEGRLRAINPEFGIFGVAPGTGAHTNPNAIAALSHDTIFTNVAATDEGDVWWEGLTEDAPARLIDWRGQDWTPESSVPAAHPNSRFTAALSQVPSIAPEWEDPEGVPISAILFGGRRASVVPLVTEAFDWAHGVFLGSIMASEDHRGGGRRRRHPAPRSLRHAALLRLSHGRLLRPLAGRRGRGADQALLPKIFYVNWFRRGADGTFLWPGYGENSRVLAWIFERCTGRVGALDTAIGRVPTGAAPYRRTRPRSGPARRAVGRGPRRVAPRGRADRGALRPLRRPASCRAARPAPRA